MTNEVHVIPISLNHHRWRVSAGLAFEPSATSTSYKVVELIEENQYEFYEYKFKIYSSVTRKWIMSNQKFIIPTKRFFSNQWNVLYKGGVIYWNSFPHILWFNISKNISGYILPPMIQNITKHSIGMTDEGILTISQLGKNYHLVWILNNDGVWVNRYFVYKNYNSNDWRIYCMGGNRLYMVSSKGLKNILYYEDMTSGELIMVREIKFCDVPPIYTWLNYDILTRIGSLES